MNLSAQPQYSTHSQKGLFLHKKPYATGRLEASEQQNDEKISRKNGNYSHIVNSVLS